MNRVRVRESLTKNEERSGARRRYRTRRRVKVMIRIGVFSDSHGDVRAIQELYAAMGQLGAVFFLGDMTADIEAFRKYLEDQGSRIPVFSVRGNNDMFSKEPDYLVVPVGERKAFLTHGHLYRVRQGTEMLCRAAKKEGCDIALYGHTHTRYCSFDEGIFVLNPGAVSGCYPSRMKTAAVLVSDGNRISMEDVVLDL